MSKLIAAKELQWRLLDEGMTQTDLSEKAEITRSQITNIVNRKVNPRAKTAKKIADALGCRVSDIFERVD